MAIPKFVAVFVLGLFVVVSASPEAPVNVIDHRVDDHRGHLLCVLLAEPVDHFTRVAPPAALAEGRFSQNAIPINVTYGAGFAANPQAQAAFQHAVNIWKTQLTSPVAISVQADFSNLGPGVLGYAFYNSIARNFGGAPMADTWFPGPIANALAGTAITGSPGISTSFSNAFTWYYGTDGLPPAGQYDFVSVVLHELAHGLGFAGSARVSGGLGAFGSGSPSSPYIFDRYLANSANQALTDTGIFPNNSAALAAQLTSNNVFWAGGEGVAANGGIKPKLYAPATWSSMSSIAHLDRATFPAGTPNSLMGQMFGSAEAVHNPGAIARGMLKDSGATVDNSCSYVLSGTSFTMGPAGGAGNLGVSTGAGCPWSASTSAPFISLTSNASAIGTGVLGYSVAANTGATRTGTITVGGQTFTLTQTGGGTTVNLSRTSLAFGAVNTGTLSNITASQAVTITFSGPPQTWIATTTTPWLQVTSGSGNGPGQFTVSVVSAAGLPASGTTTGTVTVTSGTTSIPIAVTLTLYPSTSGSAAPIGAFDTPATAVTLEGSVAVTGWALDNIEVTRVEIWRDRVAGETTPVHGGGGPGNGKIYIANAIFVSGARPDIETGYPTMPFAHRAGWGYLLLTQGLWNQGNGAYTLYAFAFDRDGHSTVLGSKAITVSNATATKPFGSIDTPGYGDTVSGSVWNFGWALTPNATPSCSVTSVQVAIDSGALSPVSYGDLRPDVAANFPGMTNTNGAGGAYYLDTTVLTNGTHSIGWYVTDSCGRAEGVGSRFFTVLNGSAATTAPAARAAAHLAGVKTGDVVNVVEPVEVRRGLETAVVYPALYGDRIIAIGQDERVEVVLPEAEGGYTAAYQVVAGQRRALPIGSSFDNVTRTFYWQPSAGFLGRYQLEFVSGHAVVGVTAVVGTAVRAAIDTPRAGAVPASFVISGWAVDLASASGTGVDTVHAWAYPQAGPPVFLGVAAIGGTRPDIAAIYGEQFAGASFSLTTPALAPGSYNVVVYPHSAVMNDFRGAQAVRVRVE